MAEDDEHYTSGEGPPASYIPKPVQFVVATACTALVVFVLVIACCLAKAQCAWHEPLVRVAPKLGAGAGGSTGRLAVPRPMKVGTGGSATASGV